MGIGLQVVVNRLLDESNHDAFALHLYHGTLHFASIADIHLQLLYDSVSPERREIRRGGGGEGEGGGGAHQSTVSTHA